jgi:hypothetical protein
MMDVTLPLEKMSVSDKLRILEEIWNNLQQTPEDVPSPKWHDDVLQQREKMVKDNTSEFSDWAEAKRRINKNIQ